VAGSIAALLLAGAWWRGARVLVKTVGPRAVAALAVRAPRLLARAAPSPVTAPPHDAPKNEAGSLGSREVFFDEFADEVCLCPDMECVGEVDRRYNRRMGLTSRATNMHAIREASARMRVCVQQLSTGG
jgi:hypothetical protein